MWETFDGHLYVRSTGTASEVRKTFEPTEFPSRLGLLGRLMAPNSCSPYKYGPVDDFIDCIRVAFYELYLPSVACTCRYLFRWLHPPGTDSVRQQAWVTDPTFYSRPREFYNLNVSGVRAKKAIMEPSSCTIQDICGSWNRSWWRPTSTPSF